MTHFAKLNGCEVKVVAPVPYFPAIGVSWRSKYSQVVKRELREGLDVYHPRYFMTPKVGMSLYGLKMFLSVLPAVKKIQKTFDFDIIDSHYVYPDGFAAALMGKYFRKPVVVSARGSDINQYSEFPIIRKLLRYTLSNAQEVIAVCQALKEAIVNLGAPSEKIAVIPNGIDTDKFFPYSKKEARRKLNLSPDKKILLSVGGLIPRKGFGLLMKAFKILFEEYKKKDLDLVIIGEGPLRNGLEEMINSFNLSKNIHLVGSVPHRDLYLWFNSADIFCLTSHREGWPNVIMESIACGIPVVATSVWGTPEIISNGIGVLAEKNERDIAQRISMALESEWDREEIVNYARNHTWDKVALSVYNVFQSVLSSQHNIPVTQ